ncbi:MAG: hypothetical protein ACE361_12735 [Aureliella sp.]
MTLGGILFLLLLLVSVIVFIFVTVKTAKTWGALHTTLLWTLFTECWIFVVFAAGVQATRVKFTKDAFVQEKKAAEATERTRDLTWGRFQPNVENLDAVVPAQGELRRLTSDRGRVWRQVTFIRNNNGEFQLELSSAAPAADDLGADPVAADDTPTSESLPVNQVVYGFSEELNSEGKPIPNFYLGEFTVTQSQDGAVTLKPTLPLTPPQVQQVRGNASSWTLYEMLPLDSHQAFAAPGSEKTEDAVFGRMDEETLGNLFAAVPTAGERQSKLLQSYTRDGQQATPDDPTSSVWAEVNMIKAESFDVDSEENANATERGFFDSSGRSIDIRLKRTSETEKGSVQLTPDMKQQLVVLKEEAARKLVEKGAAEINKRIYVRPLNDYEQAFNNHSIRMKDVAERIELYQRETGLLAAANQEGQELIGLEQVEEGKLREDIQNYDKEISVLENSVAAAKQQLTSLRSELSRLFRQVQSSAR